MWPKLWPYCLHPSHMTRSPPLYPPRSTSSTERVHGWCVSYDGMCWGVGDTEVGSHVSLGSPSLCLASNTSDENTDDKVTPVGEVLTPADSKHMSKDLLLGHSCDTGADSGDGDSGVDDSGEDDTMTPIIGNIDNNQWPVRDEGGGGGGLSPARKDWKLDPVPLPHMQRPPKGLPPHPWPSSHCLTCWYLVSGVCALLLLLGGAAGTGMIAAVAARPALHCQPARRLTLCTHLWQRPTPCRQDTMMACHKGSYPLPYH